MPKLTKKRSKLSKASKKLLGSPKQFRLTGLVVLIAILAVIGAYFILHIHAATCSTPPGDANCDTAVNVLDLSILATNFGQTSGMTWSQGDFNGDGVVNVVDLSILASHWGTSGAGASSCGLTSPAFCDTFDSPAGTGNRSGQLNGTVWGASRTTGNVNVGGGIYNSWAPTQIDMCDGTTPTVTPPNDIVICNGQLREAVDDNVSGGFEGGTVTDLAMYPKQPFDFAGRTGKVTFDVGDDTGGSHSAWPEFWMTDTPVPSPFTHFDSWESLPQYGFGIRFFGYVDGNGNGGPCPEGNTNTETGYTGVGSAITINNYVENDFDNGGNIKIVGYDCIRQPQQQGQLNHFEVDVSQNQIDIYGTDAYSGALNLSNTPLKHLATLPNVNLGFTRGLIWMEDAHYNADKGSSPSERVHTFVWDNVGFDGPVTYHDLSFDAPDVVQPAGDGGYNLGKFSAANGSATWTTLPLPSNPTAALVRVMFNFSAQLGNPTTFNISVNGHVHNVPWPYPDNQGFSWRTFQTVIPITDLVSGPNVVTIGGDQPLVTSNVNIVLVNAGP